MPRRKTAKDLVVEALRDEILSGELPPGTRLIAPELAARFAISQTPAREAIQQLEAESLVTISSYKNAIVAHLSADECEELYLMREALERLAARLSASNITDEQIQRMRSCLKQMAEAAQEHDVNRFVMADREFHEIQYSAAYRPRLWQRISGLRYAGERYTRISYERLPHEMESAIPRHESLLASLQEHDPDRASDWVASTLGRVPFRMRQLLSDDLDESSNPGVPGNS